VLPANRLPNGLAPSRIARGLGVSVSSHRRCSAATRSVTRWNSGPGPGRLVAEPGRALRKETVLSCNELDAAVARYQSWPRHPDARMFNSRCLDTTRHPHRWHLFREPTGVCVWCANFCEAPDHPNFQGLFASRPVNFGMGFLISPIRADTFYPAFFCAVATDLRKFIMKGRGRRSGSPALCAQRLARVAMTPAFAKPAEMSVLYMKWGAGTLASVRSPQALRCSKSKRALHIDPPASSYAIMRRACPYRGENHEPGKDVFGEY
jgi:hypothetical protein